jgi:hypothetical protein
VFRHAGVWGGGEGGGLLVGWGVEGGSLNMVGWFMLCSLGLYCTCRTLCYSNTETDDWLLEVIRRLNGRLVSWRNGWLCCCLVGWLVGWLVDWLAVCLVMCLFLALLFATDTDFAPFRTCMQCPVAESCREQDFACLATICLRTDQLPCGSAIRENLEVILRRS